MRVSQYQIDILMLELTLRNALGANLLKKLWSEAFHLYCDIERYCEGFHTEELCLGQLLLIN